MKERGKSGRTIAPFSNSRPTCLPVYFGSGHKPLDRIEQSVDDLLNGDAFGFSAVVDQDAMAQSGVGQGLNIFLRDVSAALKQGAHFGAEHEVLSAAQTGAPAHPV